MRFEFSQFYHKNFSVKAFENHQNISRISHQFFKMIPEKSEKAKQNHTKITLDKFRRDFFMLYPLQAAYCEISENAFIYPWYLFQIISSKKDLLNVIQEHAKTAKYNAFSGLLYQTMILYYDTMLNALKGLLFALYGKI